MEKQKHILEKVLYLLVLETSDVTVVECLWRWVSRCRYIFVMETSDATVVECLWRLVFRYRCLLWAHSGGSCICCLDKFTNCIYGWLLVIPYYQFPYTWTACTITIYSDLSNIPQIIGWPLGCTWTSITATYGSCPIKPVLILFTYTLPNDGLQTHMQEPTNFSIFVKIYRAILYSTLNGNLIALIFDQ